MNFRSIPWGAAPVGPVSGRTEEFFDEKIFQLCEDCQRRLHTNPLRIFDCKVETCQEAIADAPQVIDFICPECQKHFDKVKEYLEMAGLDLYPESQNGEGTWTIIPGPLSRLFPTNWVPRMQ